MNIVVPPGDNITGITVNSNVTPPADAPAGSLVFSIAALNGSTAPFTQPITISLQVSDCSTANVFVQTASGFQQVNGTCANGVLTFTMNSFALVALTTGKTGAPVGAAPAPPNTGTGIQTLGGSSTFWALAVLGAAIALAGAAGAGLTLRRRDRQDK